MVDELTLGDLVKMTWVDAHSSVQQEMTLDEIAQEVPCGYDSYGILVRNDDISVAVAADQRDDGRYRGVTFVPRGMVITVSPIRPRRKRKAKTVPQVSEPNGH